MRADFSVAVDNSWCQNFDDIRVKKFSETDQSESRFLFGVCSWAESHKDIFFQNTHHLSFSVPNAECWKWSWL